MQPIGPRLAELARHVYTKAADKASAELPVTEAQLLEVFDVLRPVSGVDFRHYIAHGEGNVFAFRQLNHLTDDAPTQNLAPVQLRGYKVGQYTGRYMSHVEAEERLRLRDRWTATVFAGIGKDLSITLPMQAASIIALAAAGDNACAVRHRDGSSSSWSSAQAARISRWAAT